MKINEDNFPAVARYIERYGDPRIRPAFITIVIILIVFGIFALWSY